MSTKPWELQTALQARRSGVAKAVLEHIITVARSRRYARLSLETGSQDAFAPAHRLYEGFGFDYCPPIEGYLEDPNSVLMTIALSPAVK